MAEKTTQSPGDEARRTALVVAVSTYADDAWLARHSATH